MPVLNWISRSRSVERESSGRTSDEPSAPSGSPSNALPVLLRPDQLPAAGAGRGRSRLLESCANPECGSGWLHLWRNRTAPVFEAGWSCSPECTRTLVENAVRRELDGRTRHEESHRHRIPLGLVMLEQGWLSSADLRRALDAQRAAGSGRLGQWLVGLGGVSEALLARALALQWSCPVLGIEYHDPEALASIVPRLFVDAYGALPLRMAAGRLLYLGFEDRLDPVLAFAIERMTGLRVESGMVRESEFRPARNRMLEAGYPPAELIEAASEPAAVRALTRIVERAHPIESRMVRVHHCLWLRLWSASHPGAPLAVEDAICSVGAF